MKQTLYILSIAHLKRIEFGEDYLCEFGEQGQFGHTV